ncbi:unnamed protein product [Brassica oleracea]
MLRLHNDSYDVCISYESLLLLLPLNCNVPQLLEQHINIGEI